MTVAELIAELQEMPQGMEVYIADYEYGPGALTGVERCAAKKTERGAVQAGRHSVEWREREAVFLSAD